MQIKQMTLPLKKLASAVRLSRLAYAGLIAGQIASPSAQAAPEGGVVVGGKGTINTQDLTTIVDQKTDLLAIDWDSFNLTEEELVKFLQPNSSSIVLNRILDQSPTTIRGTIEANGHVIIANPRGVLFTENATINVGAITAAGLNISPADFMKGEFSFNAEDGSAGFVVNRGLINASSAVMVGRQVTNAPSGLISAEMVSLAAADEAVLTFDADGLIGVKITKEVMENALGVDSAVLNEGNLDGAQVLMDAQVSGELFTSAVNNKGTVRAQGIDTSGGKIRLFGAGSSVVNSGQLDASGQSGGEVVINGDSAVHSGKISVRGENGSGGDARVLGEQVTVSGTIDARGPGGGGEVLIGGGYQGRAPDVRNSKTTAVTATAEIDASGTGAADGGKVVVWSDDTTSFSGTIRAESGALGGNGGLVETSGKVSLHLGQKDMAVSTVAHSAGQTGTWLLDPGWLEIKADADCAENCVSAENLVTALGSNNVTIATTADDSASVTDASSNVDITENSPDYSSGILVASNLIWTSGNTLTLDSHADVQIDTGVTLDASGTTDDGNLAVNAAGDFINLGSITVADFSLALGGSFINSGSATVNSLNLALGNSGGDTDNTLGSLSVAGSGLVSGGAGADKFTLSAADDVLLVSGSEAFTLNGNIDFTSIASVDTGSGADSVTGADGQNWILNSVGGIANSGITFTEVETLIATNASLVGTSNDESYTVEDDGDVVVGGFTLQSLSGVDTGGGTDTVVLASSAAASLNGNDGEATIRGLDFTNIEVVSNGTLQASDAGDRYRVTGSDSVEANAIAFSGVTSIAAGGGSDTVTGSVGEDWLLDGSDGVVNNGITFTGVEIVIADTAGLIGSSSDETYTLQDNSDVVIGGVTFQSLTGVDAGGGTDTVALASSAAATLNGNDGEATIRGLDFANIEAVGNGTLQASDAGDRYVVTEATNITANQIAFANITSVTAGSGNDTVTSADNVTSVLGNVNGSVSVAGIDFANIEQVDTVNTTVDGTSNGISESFTQQGSLLSVLGIDFTSAGMALAGSEADDSVTSDATTWTLTDTEGQITAGNTTFSGIEISHADSATLSGTSTYQTYRLTAAGELDIAGILFDGLSLVNTAGSSDLLQGTAGADTFTLDGSGNVTIAGMQFSGLETVDAGSDSDTLIAQGLTLALTGTDYEADFSGSLRFAGIENVTVSELLGTEGNDQFYLQGNKALRAAEINFSGVDKVDALGEIQNSDGDALYADSADAKNGNHINGIQFKDLEKKFATHLIVTGSDDEISVVGDSLVYIGSLSDVPFEAVETVDGGDGTDTVIGFDGADWTITGINQAENFGILFSNVEILEAVNAGLIAPAGLDGFTLVAGDLGTPDISISSAGLLVAGAGSVLAGGNGSLDAGILVSGVSLTSNSYEVDAEGIVFSGIDSVSAPSLAATDISTDFLAGANPGSLSASGIDFTDLSEVVAGSGTADRLTVTGDVTLLNDGETFSSNGINYSGVDIVDAATFAIGGSGNDETFNLSSANAFDIDLTGGSHIEFSNVASIDAGGGYDTINTAGNVVLNGIDGEASAEGIALRNIEGVTNGTMVVSDNGDNFIVTGIDSVRANGIDFSGISSVTAGSGQDSATGLEGENWSMNGGSLPENHGIAFENVEEFYANNAGLDGSDGADTFELQADGSVLYAGYLFSALNSVNAGAGNDTLDASGSGFAVTLAGSDYQLNAGGIDFFSIENAITTALVGSAGTDTFQVTGDKALDAWKVHFSNVTSVTAADGDVLEAGFVSLTGGANNVTSSNITISGITNVTTANLEGTAANDSFDILADKQVSANLITFSGVDSVDALGGQDTVIGVSGSAWQLGNVVNNNVAFVGVEIVDANLGSLKGTTSDDTFVLDSAGAVTSGSVTFTNLASVNGFGGSDTLDATAYSGGLALTGSANQVTAGDLVFSNIFSAMVGTLAGSSNADEFSMDSANSLSAGNITFNGVTAIDGSGGSDLLQVSGDGRSFSVSGLNSLGFDSIAVTGLERLEYLGIGGTATGAAGVDWILGGVAGEAENSQITFAGVQTLAANTAGLVGTGADETYSLEDNGDVVIHGLTFQYLSSVDAGSGDDSVVLTTSVDAILNGSDGEANIRGVDFSGIESVANATIQASAQDDHFEITGINQLKANNIAFAGISNIDALGGSDSVIGDGSDWTLLANGIDIVNSGSGITFSNAEQISVGGAGLYGSDTAENFTLSSSGVEVDGMTFSGLTFVSAGNAINAIDDLNAVDYDGTLALNGSNNELDADGLLFLGLDTVSTGALLGSVGDDEFAVAADGRVTVADMVFSGLGSVDASDGNDEVQADGAIKMAGNSGKATIVDIAFENIESATGTGINVIATDGDDEFEVLDDGRIFTNGITFSGVTSIDALGGQDLVTGASGFNWLLQGTNQAQNNGVSFSNVEQLVAVDAALIGTIGDDSFSLLANGNIDVWDMVVSGMLSVDAGSGADSLNALAYGSGLVLNGTNQLGANGLLFSGIDSAEASLLAGTSGADSFAISDNGQLSVAGIDFSSVLSLDGGGGADQVTSLVDDDWALIASNNQVDHAGILFSGIGIFSGGNGVLSGSDNGAEFSIVGAGSLSVGGILRFDGVDTVVAGAGADALTALTSVTLINTVGGFDSNGITFSGIDSVATGNLVGTDGNDSFEMLADSELSVYGLTVTGIDSLDAGGGNDTVLGRNGQGYQLNSGSSVVHDGIVFSGVEDFAGQGATLTATAGDDGMIMTAANAVGIDSTNLSFSGLIAVDAGAGIDSVAALDLLGPVALNGTKSITAGSIRFDNIDKVTATGGLIGTDNADQFSLVAGNQLDSYGIRFEGVTSVAAAGGSDDLVGLNGEDWQLSGSENALTHAGIDFTGIETTSGGSQVLTGSALADRFTITANNQVTANGITFTGIYTVDAGADSDEVSSAAGESWILGLADGSAAAAGIEFTNIDSVSGADLSVDASTNSASDNFLLGDSGQSISVRGIDFASVSNVAAGADGGDSITGNANDWQLSGTDGAVTVNGISITGMDRVVASNARLIGTGNSETFLLSGEHALTVAGIDFEGISTVAAAGGNDQLQGTAGDDLFTLTQTGSIGIDGISFGSLETVAAGAGTDSVNSNGASWTSDSSGGALVPGRAVATVNSVTAIFDGIERVNGADTYVGTNIDSEYVFDSLTSFSIAGITYSGLGEIIAGSGADTLRGADIDAEWSIGATQGTIRSGGESLVFSGIESITAGSGADRITLSGGDFNTIDTGGGNDIVNLAGASLDSLALGAGDDELQVQADSSATVAVSGGTGDDRFQFSVAGKTWSVTSSGNSVGNFQFGGFEWLDNTAGNLVLETNQGFDFVNGGESSERFNLNGAGVMFASSGMRLGYNGTGDVNILSNSTRTIGGDLQAGRADLAIAGDLDINANVHTLNVHTTGADIDIAVVAQKDLIIDEINAGRGNITLNSLGFGSLTAETYGDTHLTSGTVRLGSELQQWSVIGSAINPLRMDASQSVDIVSISYFEPDFIGQIPAFTTKGDELQSIAGAQAAQGLKSAVQNAVDDFAQVDPAIFNAVNPYSSGVDAVNTPEMRLDGDVLLPALPSSSPDDEDDLRGRSSQSDEPQEPPVFSGQSKPVASANAGG